MSLYKISQAADETGYYVHGPQRWTGYTQALGIRRGVVLLSAKSVGDDWAEEQERGWEMSFCGCIRAVEVQVMIQCNFLNLCTS